MMKCYPVSYITTKDYTKRVENRFNNFELTFNNHQAYISYWRVTQSLFPEKERLTRDKPKDHICR